MKIERIKTEQAKDLGEFSFEKNRYTCKGQNDTNLLKSLEVENSDLAVENSSPKLNKAEKQPKTGHFRDGFARRCITESDIEAAYSQLVLAAYARSVAAVASPCPRESIWGDSVWSHSDIVAGFETVQWLQERIVMHYLSGAVSSDKALNLLENVVTEARILEVHLSRFQAVMCSRRSKITG